MQHVATEVLGGTCLRQKEEERNIREDKKVCTACWKICLLNRVC